MLIHISTELPKTVLGLFGAKTDTTVGAWNTFEEPVSFAPSPRTYRPAGPTGKQNVGASKVLTIRKPTAKDSTSRKVAVEKSAKVCVKKEEVTLNRVESVIKKNVRLSDVNWQNIQSLGISRVPLRHLDRATVKKRLGKHVASIKISDPKSDLHQVDVKWEEIFAEVQRFFRKMAGNANPRGEFYARSFIDHFVLHLAELPEDRIRFFQSYTLSTPDSGSVFRTTLPEDLKEHLANPVELSSDLTVTGHVDYTLVRVRDSREMKFNGVQAGVPSNIDRTIMTQDGSTIHPDILLLPIEAKSQEGNLESAIPQVLAQAFVIRKKTGRRHVPWCLSNGCDWIFGISTFPLTRQSRSNKATAQYLVKAGYVAFKVNSLWDKKVGLHDLETAGSSEEKLRFANLMTRAKTVWRLCNLWAMTEPEALLLLWEAPKKT